VPTLTSPPPGRPFVDLSSHQDPRRTDWHAIAASGVREAYLRAAEGKDPDTAYQAHRDAARAAGVKVGAYSFWRPRHAAMRLVDVFLSVIGDDWDLPPVIDLEAEAPVDLLTPELLEAHVDAGLVELQERAGVEPLLYAGPGFVAAHLPRGHQLGRWGLWCAAYTSRLLLPRGWSTAVAWQWTGAGVVPGYPGPAGRSVWLGEVPSGESFRPECEARAGEPSFP
jgi:GH25 family lysozyme M1 (1,4-beta-N-acetylmuramidase)